MRTEIRKFDPRNLVLLERNARYMRHEQFARLVDNVRKDGRLTSVPFAVREPDGRYLVLSGNHRTRAAIDAGLKEIEVMVTDDELSHDQRIGIQLSHNSIAGDDDLGVLKSIYESVENVDWRQYSGLDDKTLELLAEIDTSSINEANLDYQSLSILFFPSEVERVKAVLEEALALASGASEKWVARYDDHARMLKALSLIGESSGVSNVATSIGLLLDVFEDNVNQLSSAWWDEKADEAKHNNWVPVETVTGANAPATSLGVVKKALEKAIGRGEADTPWQALEVLAAEYLAGA
jgi:hypothetical protein